ncbi:Diaminopimelate epimerase-like protein [Aspergillus steynii IBT 23096]|uniref:Diaminopimelate epimerase-like protein n=1 Tax=Aspergillus steynii IBT 23096 TaxID=1392250 RepID=A0A2I2GHH4_9EURO|nr:Diaminopimelate epimerase-like protein [Aspergillus steynii IBT 23096]PLB52325.1 Diaminopimelate epimerase-like protein [Aspergillus steynii IBT 23096]
MFLNYVVVDVFTTTRFKGNPLAIVQVPANYWSSLSQEAKQLIAVEFNLSETIFLHEPPEDSQDPTESVSVDIFTPKCEIPFAGHPTIGSAAYIFQNYPRAANGGLKELVTKAGRIPVSQDLNTSLVSASIPFDYHLHQTPVLSSLAVSGAAPVTSIVKGMTFVLAELRDLDCLKDVSAGLVEDCIRPQGLDEGWNHGLMATKYYVDLGKNEQGCRQLRTRMFVSWEDPGTGSASSALSCFLALEEPKEQGSGPFEYHIVQGVEIGRRNDIFVRVSRSVDGERITEVLLRGTSVLVSEGRITV